MDAHGAILTPHVWEPKMCQSAQIWDVNTPSHQLSPIWLESWTELKQGAKLEDTWLDTAQTAGCFYRLILHTHFADWLRKADLYIKCEALLASFLLNHYGMFSSPNSRDILNRYPGVIVIVVPMLSCLYHLLLGLILVLYPSSNNHIPMPNFLLIYISTTCSTTWDNVLLKRNALYWFRVLAHADLFCCFETVARRHPMA